MPVARRSWRPTTERRAARRRRRKRGLRGVLRTTSVSTAKSLDTSPEIARPGEAEVAEEDLEEPGEMREKTGTNGNIEIGQEKEEDQAKITRRRKEKGKEEKKTDGGKEVRAVPTMTVEGESICYPPSETTRTRS